MMVAVGIAVIGGIIWVAGKIGIPLGRLPGDVSVKRGNFTFYSPIATSIIVSILLTVGINVVLWFLRK